MPTYIYRREDGSTFEIRQKFSDDPLDTCPTTGQGVHRVPSASSVIFKGSGFYVTDNKGSTKAVTSTNGNGASTSDAPASEGTASTASENGAKSEVKSDAKPKSDAKSETKTA